MGEIDIASLPGFRRRIALFPTVDRVTAAVEDDYHCMAVTLAHDGTTIMAVSAVMDRAPWTTCPGAPAVLTETFTGVTLAEAQARGDKKRNCTHLHDLAVLAAAHAADVAPSRYDILVCDPVDGLVAAQIRRDGEVILRLEHRDDVVVAPAAIAGVTLFKLREWIDSLDRGTREAARLLQWGTILAHGRTTPLERQSDASRMPSNCFTFQPERKHEARRVGRIVDFSAGDATPLEHDGLVDYPGGTRTSGGGVQESQPDFGKEIVR